jgi:Mrp family chromosome partitioning ATPase
MAVSDRMTRANPSTARSRGTGLLVSDPACPTAVREAYQQAALNIRFASLGMNVATTLVCAVDGSAPAAPVAVNLAIQAAQEGEHCIVVDANPQAPSLDQLFSIDEGPGFSTIIRHEGSDVLGALHTTDIPNLFIMGAGSEGGVPGGIGRARALGEVLLRLKNDTDRLYLVGAPVLIQIDTTDLVPLVDSVIVAMTTGTTHRDDAKRAREILARVHAPVLGVILTQQAQDTKKRKK